MSRRFLSLLAAPLMVLAPAGAWAAEPDKSAVLPIMEDGAAELLKVLNNPTGDPGEGRVEEKDTFTGPRCIKIIPLQRFTNKVPGWELKVREKPGPGEYRYLRFAWKSLGGSGIMLQLHDTDWHMRYVAGNNAHGWAAKSVAPKAPPQWAVVTCDLFADWGERTITGIALTVFDGEGGLFDHIYLARTMADLDRIDATGLRQKAARPKPSEKDLEELWNKLAGDNDRDAYWAFWTLAAASERAVPFLKTHLPLAPVKVDPKQLRRWILELDHETFAVRENARRGLEKNLDAAAGLLERELEHAVSPEARRRIERLLQMKTGPNPEQLRQERAVRVLAVSDSQDSRKVLEDLAKGAEGNRLTELARAALERK